MKETVPTQRKDEWNVLDGTAMKYHRSQWDSPKRSTLALEEHVRERVLESDAVVDLACGAGGPTAWLAKHHPTVKFTGLDYSAELIGIARSLAIAENVTNLSFETGDWFNLDSTSQYDGVISFQTLSWLPAMEAPMLAIFERLHPRWIGLSSLFFDGDISCKIEVTEHASNKQSFYNVYSLPALERLCAKHDYRIECARPFNIDIDLAPLSDRNHMGTYTKRVIGDNDVEERLQFSGPLLMPWWMVLIAKV